MSRSHTAMATATGQWTRKTKVLVSLLLAAHLLAVVAEPFRFFTYSGTRGSSPAAEPLRVALAPYVEFAFLNHGYFFFAPEPGPSHLLHCELQFADGSRSVIRYPDKSAQRPRLLYHRHFMLAEFLNQLHVPPVDPQWTGQASQAELDGWIEGRRRYDLVKQSMQSHLATRYGATTVTIDRLRHALPGSEAVLKQGLPLDDPSLYILLPDTLENGPPPVAGYRPGPVDRLPQFRPGQDAQPGEEIELVP